MSATTVVKVLAALFNPGRYRKALTALVVPWIPVAGNYLGGPHVPHVWWLLFIGELGALGVYAVPNSTSSLDPAKVLTSMGPALDRLTQGLGPLGPKAAAPAAEAVTPPASPTVPVDPASASSPAKPPWWGPVTKAS